MKILSDCWLRIVNLRKRKILNKELNGEIMLVVWHPRRWWNSCMSQKRERGTEPTFTEQCFNCISSIQYESTGTFWAALMKQLLSTDWSYITLLSFVKLSALLIGRGRHKRYATLTTLAAVWELWSFKIFFWSGMCWWALNDWNSFCLQIDHTLCSLALLSWPLCWLGRVTISDMQRSQT